MDGRENGEWGTKADSLFLWEGAPRSVASQTVPAGRYMVAMSRPRFSFAASASANALRPAGRCDGGNEKRSKREHRERGREKHPEATGKAIGRSNW
jgi:hypothetical protein